MKQILLLFSLVVLFSSGFAEKRVFAINDYGTMADAKTINTAAIQKAIDARSQCGGGSVYVPSGTYITGTFNLESKVNLNLESGAVLKGSSSLKDYKDFTVPGYGTYQYGILYTENAVDVSITGFGKIKGNDTAFFGWDKAKKIE